MMLEPRATCAATRIARFRDGSRPLLRPSLSPCAPNGAQPRSACRSSHYRPLARRPRPPVLSWAFPWRLPSKRLPHPRLRRPNRLPSIPQRRGPMASWAWTRPTMRRRHQCPRPFVRVARGLSLGCSSPRPARGLPTACATGIAGSRASGPSQTPEPSTFTHSTSGSSSGGLVSAMSSSRPGMGPPRGSWRRRRRILLRRRHRHRASCPRPLRHPLRRRRSANGTRTRTRPLRAPNTGTRIASASA